MRYKLLGNSGLRVSELSLGTMTFGEEWGWGSGRDQAREVFDTYVDAGGNFIDTANLYTNGTSEKLVGEFIAAERERFVLATKFTLSGSPGDPNSGGNHRKNMMQSVEASLRRLDSDYIDLYWVHAWDSITPVDEIMRGLDDLVSSGKVLYVGVSDAPAWAVARANTLAELRGWSRFVGLQIQYSLVERTPERELLPMAEALDITVTPWAVLGAGLLTGKYTRGDQRPKHSRGDWGEESFTERNLAIARTVDAVADEIDRPSSQVALAWSRQAPSAQMIPIVGARTAAQLRESLASLEVELSDDQLDRLDHVSRIDLGFPHEFLSRPAIQHIVYGGSAQLLDLHRRHSSLNSARQPATKLPR